MTAAMTFTAYRKAVDTAILMGCPSDAAKYARLATRTAFNIQEPDRLQKREAVQAQAAALRAAVGEALDIIEQHAYVAPFDAEFDGGEFSGPEHSRMQDREIEVVARTYGFTYDAVMNALNVEGAA